jgi:anaerobic magnesium-protoporphyrin IX monomethyl ester cyclase
MRKRILLVQPKVGSWEFIQSTPMLPLALLSISSYLDGDYDIKIIDQRINPRWAATLKEELGKGDVLCVGVSTMTGPQIGYALEATKIVKGSSNVPVVWGGIHPSILPEQTISHPLIDIVVAGEGEFAFRDLVHALERKEPHADIQGVWTKKHGNPRGSMAGGPDDINELPRLPYQLVRLADYISFDRDGHKKFPVKTSRGCPYRCTFCHQTSNYRKKWRAFTPDRVLEELEMVKNEHGIQHFQIVDDNFFVDANRAHEILKRIAAKKWKDTVFTINGTRVSDIIRLKEETLKLLAEIGCYELQIGLESGSQRVLDHMKKDITLSQVFEANERLKRYKIPRYYELVSGFRDETIEDMGQTAQIILKLSDGDSDVFFSPLECLTPYPGTEVYAQAVEAGMKFPDSLEGWSVYEWSKAKLPWLEASRKKFLESFHIFPTFISSEIKTIRSPFVKSAFKMYRPIARLRVRTRFFGMPVEAAIFNFVTKLRS